MPPDKHVSIYDQHSPVGSSRVVAGAVDIDEHVCRAASVSSMPSKNPWQAKHRLHLAQRERARRPGVYVPELGEFLHSSSDIPQHILDMFVRNKQKIGQCEILAANVPYYSLPDLFRGRQVIHWIDNTSAISCLIHGYSGRPDSALLVNAFNMFNAGFRCRIHYEYVEITRTAYRRDRGLEPAQSK